MLIAIIRGIPLGIVIGRTVWTAIANSSNLLVRADVGSAVPLAATVMLLVVVVISLWPAWRARRINVAAALRTE